MNIEQVIKDLTDKVEYLMVNKEDMDEASWNYELGIIITGNEALTIINHFKPEKPSD